MSTTQNIRPSPIAGTWYPGNAKTLAASIDGYLSAANTTPVKGQIKAIIVPHAGHRYSGGVAAYAYNAIREKPVNDVAIISPMHQLYPGRLLTTAHEAYMTPLGPVPVNRELVQHLDSVLITSLDEGLTPISRDQEHSLEIQLPFLQRVYPGGFNLVPIMLRDQMPDTTHALADALVEVMPKGSLLIASSDLSHFYSDSDARELDAAILEAIRDFSPEKLYQVETEARGFACGLGAIAAVLWAARGFGADRVDILNQANSGDITGDRSSVVGYASGVVYKSI
jgi:AmmeMemoRadiSam system protein B